MTDLVRQEIVTAAEIVVVKVGTRVLTRKDGSLDDKRVASIAGQIAQLWQSGRRVVLVSSGAVGAGLGRLQQTTRPASSRRGNWARLVDRVLQPRAGASPPARCPGIIDRRRFARSRPLSQCPQHTVRPFPLRGGADCQ